MQFCVQTSPGEATIGYLRALHLSLNAPVIAVDELPVGPARAGIALREGSSGEPRLHIAIRALRTGQVAFYTSMSTAEPDAGSAPDLDAALSFAEGMGFLFDEDEFVRRGPEGAGAAEDLWRELVGEPAERVPDDVITLETLVGTGGIAPEAEPRIDSNRPPVLSKFRFSHGVIAAPPPSARVEADSRIRLLSRF